MSDTATRTVIATGVAGWGGAAASAAPETTTPVEQPVEYRYDGGDHERFSHYVPKDQLMKAMVEGTKMVRKELAGAA